MKIESEKIELPNSWAAVKLGDFVENEKGKKPKNESKTETDSHHIPYVDIQAFEENVIRTWTDGVGCRVCYETDFLMVWDGSRSGLVGKGMNGALGSTLVRIYFPSMVNDYAFYFLQSKYQQINTRAKGVGIPHVDPALLWNYDFPIAPLNEQKCIVAKIEELFSELDKGIENLKTARAQLKVYRQALLKHAFEGKLTAQWRAENQDKLETADALQKRIQQERAQRYQRQLADWQTNGGSKPKAPKPLPPLTAEELAELPELPEGWGWCKWEDILVSEKGAFKRGPFGSALKKEFFVKSGYKVYEQYCPINDDCSFERYYISDEKFRELEGFSVRAEDFLVSCSGVTLGRITQVPLNFKEGIINQALLRVRVNSAIYDFQFFKTFFRSRYFQKRIFENSTGTAIPNVKGVNELKAIPLPLCSLLEQQQIVLELEARLSEVDQLDQTITASLQQAEALRQSILKKAFSGQLVPQDPHDEPASALLARIRAEREQSDRPKRGRKSL
ncbi:MAG: hypothetical protein COX57_12890 [Alphaproteobacteria bacterium CG_4_10_14_0_2_um_filter_63_37]|nr:MAG: hypothetical protein COX57_12890 [Alphaproteobacteria bacterium CG_4_10_14_0_2_um_filter_63_37]